MVDLAAVSFGDTERIMEKLKVAVIGLGMGRMHLQEFSRHSGAEVVGFADVDESRFARCRELAPKARTYTDYKQLLRTEKPDLVTVALPNFLHEQVVCDALREGAHVLCEKPMSLQVESALRMRDAAEAHGRGLYINFSKRFSPQGQAARRLVDEGALGPVYHAISYWTRRDGIPGFGGWFGQKEKSGGGPLIDLGVHQLDLVLWLMGKVKPVTVSGCAHQRRAVVKAREAGKAFDVEDLACGFLRMDNGASIQLEVSWDGYYARKECSGFRLMGECGGLETAPGPHGPSTLHYAHDVAGSAVNSVPLQHPHSNGSCHELASCLLENRPFSATAADGIRVQIILDALYESAASGREVAVEEFAGKALSYL